MAPRGRGTPRSGQEGSATRSRIDSTTSVHQTLHDKVRDVCAELDIGPLPDLPTIGTVRCPGAGKSAQNRSAWIRVKADCAHIVDHSAGGLTVTVQAGRDAPPIDRAEFARKRRQGEQLEARRQEAAIQSAARAWDDAEPCVRPPYCDRKGVFGYGCRWDDDTRTMLVPLRDVDGALRSLQRIDDDGTKRCWPGAPVAGAFFTLGTIVPTGEVLLCEGFATAATLFEETGRSVVAAMFAGNLLAVARALHVRHPELRIVVCADDDRRTDGNPGRTKGAEAAGAVAGRVAFPDLCRCCTCTDFNDQAACERRRADAA